MVVRKLGCVCAKGAEPFGNLVVRAKVFRVFGITCFSCNTSNAFLVVGLAGQVFVGSRGIFCFWEY